MSSPGDDHGCDLSAMLDLLDEVDDDIRSCTAFVTELGRNGMVKIDAALTHETSTRLLDHITRSLASQLRGKKIQDHASARQECSASLRGIFGNGIDQDILEQVLDGCSEGYKLDQAMEYALELMEEGASVVDATELTLREAATAQSNKDLVEYNPELWGSIHEQTNRWDLKLDVSPAVMAALAELIPRVQPIVDATLGEAAWLVEMSSLISDPGSPAQPLHADTLWTAQAEALTCFVALQDIDVAMGPTVMLPCTHLHPSHWQKAVKNGGPDYRSRVSHDRAFLKSELGTPEAVHCTGTAGSVFLMDSRLLHFGGANLKENGSQRVLFYLTFRRRESEETKVLDGTVGPGWWVAPGWWISNGGDRIVDTGTLEQLRAYEAKMGSTMSLLNELHHKFAIGDLSNLSEC